MTEAKIKTEEATNMAYTISDMLNDYMYETFGDVTTDAEFNSSNIIMSETTVTRGELRCYDEV